MGLFFMVVRMVAVLFRFIINPIVLSFLVVIMGVLVIIFLGLVLPMFWFRYIILLTFLGGLLVVFVYVSSLCPNEPVMAIGKNRFLLVGLLALVGAEWGRGRDLCFYGGSLDVVCLIKIYCGGLR